MESWTRIILEWANCLGIAKKHVSELRDLQDSLFYQELLTKLSQKDEEAIDPTNEAKNTTVTSEKSQELWQFIKAEYPEFTRQNDGATIVEPSDEVCVASLLLLHCAQEPVFHRPMCTNLKHETQIQIKHFLELVLPYNNKITRETILTAIAELRDESQKIVPTTPKYRPLRAFFNSPAARSAQSQRYANDRNREFLRLKAELETEKFEKADLYDDIKVYTEKINNLQKKLNEKTLELKTLRDRGLNDSSAGATPIKKQSCNCMERYKREFSRLENVNRDLEAKYEELRADSEDKDKILLANERIRVSFEKKLEELEKIIETTSLQLEERNNEILGLRANNDELRLHINEVQRSLINDQSFEVESVNYAHLSNSMNTSETMGSIIDLQYREAREEIILLRKEADAVKERLDNVTRECDNVKSLNNVLKQKIADAEVVETNLRSLQVVLKRKNERITSLEENNADFAIKLTNIHKALETTEKTLTNERNSKEALEIELSNQNKKNEDLENEIASLNTNFDDLKNILESKEQSLLQNQSRIADLEQLLESNKKETMELKNLLDESKISLCSKEKLLEEVENSKRRIETEFAGKIQEIENRKEILENEVTELKKNYETLMDKLSNTEILLNEAKDQNKVTENELREKSIKFDREIVETVEQLRCTMENNEKLVKNESKLMEKNQKLEDELSKTLDQLNCLNNEKAILDNELVIYSSSNKDFADKIVALQSEVKEYCKKFEDERELTVRLENNEFELKKQIEEFKIELKLKAENLASLSGEKRLLGEKLIISEQEKQNLIDETRELREKLEKFIKEREESESKLKKLIDEQTSELSTLENQLEREKREKERIIEENTIKTQQLVTNLEQRLSEAEKACAEAAIEKKTTSDELRVAETKIERLTIERDDFERRNIEIVTNLRELRISQEVALQAVVKALEDKSEQLEKCQQNIFQLENSLKAKDDEISTEKSLLLTAEAEISKLRLETDRQNKFVTELREQLEIERSESRKSLESLEFTKNELKNVETLSNGLENELDGLWDIVRRVCPELAAIEKEKSMKSNDNKENLPITDISLILQDFKENITKIVKTMSIIIEANETLKDSVENYKKIAENTSDQLEKLKNEFDAKKELIKKEKTQQEDYLMSIIKEIQQVEDLLLKVYNQRTETIEDIKSITEKWGNVDNEAKPFLNVENSTGNSVCDELKHLQANKIEIDDSLRKFTDKINREMNLLIKTTCRTFSGFSTQLKSVESSMTKKEDFQSLNKEIRDIFDAEIKDFEAKKREFLLLKENISNFEKLLKSHATNVKKGSIKRETNVEDKYQLQLDKIQREKRELKEKFDSVRMRNTKMEKNMDDLRNEIKRLKTESSTISASEKKELEKLRIVVDELEKKNTNFVAIKQEIPDEKVKEIELERLKTAIKDLETENAKLRREKDEFSSQKVDKSEYERLRMIVNDLEKKNQKLRNENDEFSRKKLDTTKDIIIQDLKKEISSLRSGESSESREKAFEERLKEVHAEYGTKLEKIKQKMKAAYNEQVSKLNQEQEKILNEKMETMRKQMEQQCRKYTDDIVKYKAHITDLSSRYWDVGEKLLAETQQRQSAVYQLEQLTGTRIHEKETMAEMETATTSRGNRFKTASLDRREFGMDRGTRESSSRPTHHAVEVIKEETILTTRRHSVKSIQALGNAFSVEDEEGEVFDNVYLADMKDGRFPKTAPDLDRLSELRMRNSMCKPHLKSSYAVETNYQPVNLTEDDIKGSELKSPNSRILREKNVERRTTATPRRLKDLFGTSSSKRQDENSTGTPTRRRLSNIFRNKRTERN